MRWREEIEGKREERRVEKERTGKRRQKQRKRWRKSELFLGVLLSPHAQTHLAGSAVQTLPLTVVHICGVTKTHRAQFIRARF